MIDSSVDADFAALERTESQRETATPVRRRAPATLATLPSLPASRAGELAEEPVVSMTVQPSRSAASDPVGHLRAARLGFAAVVVLVLYWLWIRRKRA